MANYSNNKKSVGLKGGPNEYITHISDLFSVEGYKADSPDVNNPYNIIQSGNITMEGVDFPVIGTDNLGNRKLMTPGNNYQFPGNQVFETPMAQTGIEVPKRQGVRDNGDGSESTHLMRTETLDGENWFSFPTLFQNEDGTWVDMSISLEEPWEPVYQEALRRGEVIDFGTDKEAAIKFGEGSWKKKLKNGGDLRMAQEGFDLNQTSDNPFIYGDWAEISRNVNPATGDTTIFDERTGNREVKYSKRGVNWDVGYENWLAAGNKGPLADFKIEAERWKKSQTKNESDVQNRERTEQGDEATITGDFYGSGIGDTTEPNRPGRPNRPNGPNGTGGPTEGFYGDVGFQGNTGITSTGNTTIQPLTPRPIALIDQPEIPFSSRYPGGAISPRGEVLPNSYVDSNSSYEVNSRKNNNNNEKVKSTFLEDTTVTDSDGYTNMNVKSVDNGNREKFKQVFNIYDTEDNLLAKQVDKTGFLGNPVTRTRTTSRGEEAGYGLKRMGGALPKGQRGFEIAQDARMRNDIKTGQNSGADIGAGLWEAITFGAGTVADYYTELKELAGAHPVTKEIFNNIDPVTKISNALDILSIPGSAVAEAVEGIGGLGDGEFNVTDIIPNMSGDFSFTNINNEPVKNVAGVAGVENPVGAFALNLFTDPSTYVGTGIAKNAIKKGINIGAKSIDNVASNASKLTIEGLEDATYKIGRNEIGNLTRSQLDDVVTKRKAWVNSDEYIKRRTKQLAKSDKFKNATNADVAKYINDDVKSMENAFDQIAVKFNKDLDAQGMNYGKRIEIKIPDGSGVGYSPNLNTYLDVFDHEVLHAFQTQAGSHNPQLLEAMYDIAKSKLAKGESIETIQKALKQKAMSMEDISRGFHKGQLHMTTPLSSELKNVPMSGYGNRFAYLSEPGEQNARHIMAIENLVSKYGYNYGKVTDDLLSKFSDDVINGQNKFGVDDLFRNLGDDSGKTLTPGSKGWNDAVRPILENAWMFPAAGTAAVLSTQKYGGEPLPKAQDGGETELEKQSWFSGDEGFIPDSWEQPIEDAAGAIKEMGLKAYDWYKNLETYPVEVIQYPMNYDGGQGAMIPGHIEARLLDTDKLPEKYADQTTYVNRWVNEGNRKVTYDPETDYEEGVRTAIINLNKRELRHFMEKAQSFTPGDSTDLPYNLTLPTAFGGDRTDYDLANSNCADGVCDALGLDKRRDVIKLASGHKPYQTFGITTPYQVMDGVLEHRGLQSNTGKSNQWESWAQKLTNPIDTYDGLITGLFKQDGGSSSSTVNFNDLEKGIRHVESLNGVLMKNPQSSASGYYQDLFDNFKKNGIEYDGDRDAFIADTTFQKNLFIKRYNGDIRDVPGLKSNGEDLYNEYKDQVDFTYTPTEIAALSNMLGRGGTRKYLGNVLRDGQSLAEVFPHLYGDERQLGKDGKPLENKTPDEYILGFNKALGKKKLGGGLSKKQYGGGPYDGGYRGGTNPYENPFSYGVPVDTDVDETDIVEEEIVNILPSPYVIEAPVLEMDRDDQYQFERPTDQFGVDIQNLSPEELEMHYQQILSDQALIDQEYVDPTQVAGFVENANRRGLDYERGFEDFTERNAEDVKLLQLDLLDQGYDVGRTGVDGIYGSRTHGAYTSMIADAGLEESAISRYHKQYNPETYTEVKAIQSKLIEKGFLPEITEAGVTNIDGKFGDRTKMALVDYNTSISEEEEDIEGLVFENIPISLEEERCAAGMCQILELNEIQTEAIGVKHKDAWDLLENMEHSGNSTKIFNIYDDPLFDSIDENTSVSELKRITEKAKRKLQTTAQDYKVGDIVGMYYPGSKYHNQTLNSETHNTHSGFVSSISEDGTPIITHNMSGNIKNSNWDEVYTAWISRPNENITLNTTYAEQYEADDIENIQVDPRLINNFISKKERNLTSKETSIVTNIMRRADYNSKQIPEILNSSVDPEWLNAAIFGIIGVESGAGISTNPPPPRTRDELETIRGAKIYWDGTADADISLGIGKTKFASIDDFARDYFEINSPADLADDNKAVDAVSYILVKNYELYKDYAQQFPTLGLTEEDIRNMTLISYNQGNKKLLTTGRNNENNRTSEEEISALRDLYIGDQDMYNSSNYRYIPGGRQLYDNLEGPSEGYISKTNRYITEVYGGSDDENNRLLALNNQDNQPIQVLAKGGEYGVFKNYMNGEYNNTSRLNFAEGVFDKLNRKHYKDAKSSGMSAPNYIMSHLVG